LTICETILRRPQHEIQVPPEAINQLVSLQQFKVFSAIGECYNQMKDHKRNLKYLKAALDSAQHAHKLESQKTYASYEHKM
jgi:hypothetical protein